MNKSTLLFPLIRKSKNVLKNFSNSDNNRNFLIDLKYQFSKLDPSFRNLIKVMAIDISRFTLHNEDAVKEILYNKIRTNPKTYDSRSLPYMIDKKTNKKFIIYTHYVSVDNETTFESDNEYFCFISAFMCLIDAKTTEEENIQERDKELKRQKLFSDYE